MYVDFDLYTKREARSGRLCGVQMGMECEMNTYKMKDGGAERNNILGHWMTTAQRRQDDCGERQGSEG